MPGLIVLLTQCRISALRHQRLASSAKLIKILIRALMTLSMLLSGWNTLKSNTPQMETRHYSFITGSFLVERFRNFTVQKLYILFIHSPDYYSL